MKKFFKILPLALVLMLFAYQQVGVFIITETSLAYIKLKNLTLSKEELKLAKTIIVSKDSKEIEWENGHEFIYKNKLYDCYKKEISGDKLILTSIADEDEEALDKAICSQYTNEFSISKENKNQSIKHPIKFLYTDYFSSKVQFKFYQNLGSSLTSYMPIIKLDFLISPPSPPPDFKS
ncbi:MAG: hypothetical protein NTX03_10390 [Bacteroidetes bacterium]|nr:hypothetical protein [Bacteroidota bacterium]